MMQTEVTIESILSWRLDDARGWRLISKLAVIFLVIIIVQGCAGAPSARRSQPYPVRTPKLRPPVVKELPKMGYSIQVGAFSRVENASRLTRSLEQQGVPAFYFAHASGLFKVRFGNHATRMQALEAARKVRDAGIIEAFYIVNPGEYIQARGSIPGARTLRDEIVSTAQSFLGLPYQWCDITTNERLDCSGLASAVYQLNGLNLPRASEDQFASGVPVSASGLDKGDLVFFATSGGSRISHVGIYIGDGQFIHAPGRGKVIRVEKLENAYYQERYRGACTYLR